MVQSATVLPGVRFSPTKYLCASSNLVDIFHTQDVVEPRLKYERVGNDVTSILSKDAASCLAVHPKVDESFF